MTYYIGMALYLLLYAIAAVSCTVVVFSMLVYVMTSEKVWEYRRRRHA